MTPATLTSPPLSLSITWPINSRVSLFAYVIAERGNEEESCAGSKKKRGGRGREEMSMMRTENLITIVLQEAKAGEVEELYARKHRRKNLTGSRISFCVIWITRLRMGCGVA